MIRLSFVWLTCALLLSSLLFAAEARAEDPADALFREGAEAINANNAPLAYEKFKASWSLRQSFDIAANLGVVEKALGKKRDAAEPLVYALRHSPPMNKDEQRAQIQGELDILKKELGELRIQSATGATIEVNGVNVGTCPLPAPVYVEPGQQIIVAKKPDVGEGRITVIVSVGEGKDIRVELSIGPTGKGGGPLPLWPGFLIGGAGVAAAAVGIPLLVIGQGKLSDANDLGDEIRKSGGQCNADGGGSQQCQDAKDDVDQAGTFTNAGIPLIAVGGALIIAGIIWVVVPRDSQEKPPVALLPWADDKSGGLLVGGTF